jgi:hypothetical protein
MKRSYKVCTVFTIVILLMVFFQTDALAQCPMCRLSAETNLENGGTEGLGLNRGILYMLSLPYLLVATIGYVWWRNRNRFSDAIIEEPFSDN